MQKQENTSALSGMMVIAEKEGASLGSVSHVYINAESRQMSGFTFKTSRIFGSLGFVPISSIIKIGRDIVTVQSETNVQDVTDSSPAPGMDLKTLQGHWVTTSNGQHLGRLADLDFEPTSWSITAICLADGSSLPVTASEVTFGSDEVLVPASVAANLKTNAQAPGILARMLGREASQKVSETVQKAARKMRLTKEEPSHTTPENRGAP